MSGPARRWWDETADGVPCRAIDPDTWTDLLPGSQAPPEPARAPRLLGRCIALGLALGVLAVATCILSLRVGV